MQDWTTWPGAVRRAGRLAVRLSGPLGGLSVRPSVRAGGRAVHPSVQAGGRPNTRAACVTLPQCGQGLLPSNIYSLREACLWQNGWIFGKFLNCLWSPPTPFSEKSIAIFPQTGCTSTKFAMKFFRSEMTPPFSKLFSGNSWPKLPKAKKIAMKFFVSEMTFVLFDKR